MAEIRHIKEWNVKYGSNLRKYLEWLAPAIEILHQTIFDKNVDKRMTCLTIFVSPLKLNSQKLSAN